MYLRPPFEQTQKSLTIQSSIPIFNHLSQVVLKQKIFFHIAYDFDASNTEAPGVIDYKAILDPRLVGWLFWA